VFPLQRLNNSRPSGQAARCRRDERHEPVIPINPEDLMSDKRQPDVKPWEPTIEKMPTFNPFANDQNPASELEDTPDLDDLEDGEELEPGKRK